MSDFRGKYSMRHRYHVLPHQRWSRNPVAHVRVPGGHRITDLPGTRSICACTRAASDDGLSKPPTGTSPLDKLEAECIRECAARIPTPLRE